jgi:hypothetical protein
MVTSWYTLAIDYSPFLTFVPQFYKNAKIKYSD